MKPDRNAKHMKRLITGLTVFVLVGGLSLLAIWRPGATSDGTLESAPVQTASEQAPAKPQTTDPYSTLSDSPTFPPSATTPPAQNQPSTSVNPMPRSAAPMDYIHSVELEPIAHPEFSPRFASRLDAHWPRREKLSYGRGTLPDGSGYRHVLIFSTPDLPYLIRLEEMVTQAPDGSERVAMEYESVADHLLVQVLRDKTEDELQQRLDPLGLTVTQQVSRRGLWRVSVPDPLEFDAQLAAAEKLDTVDNTFRFVEADVIVRTLTAPNDPLYLDGSLWGLNNTGQHGGTTGADIDAVNGWTIRTDAPNVVVGVVDTGILLDHEDLAANLWVNTAEVTDGTDTSGTGFVDDIHGINAILRNGNPNDDQGHGTHVAGTIGAVGNNHVGVVGVAWNVQLMGLKFLSASGGGTAADAVVAVEYGVDNGAHILNNSWGGNIFSQAIMDAVKYARDEGVIFVAAAGNSATDNDSTPVYPAALQVDNIVTVASTTRKDELSHFSCYGQGTVDIGAPGSDIVSTAFDTPTSYVSMNGTSMAAPHVAGALALLWEEFSGDDMYQLIHRLYRGVDVIEDLEGGVVSTRGRLNLHGALSTTANRPANDDFADARPLHGQHIYLRTNLRHATAETGEPSFGGEANTNTIWFSYSPVATGETTVTALASESIWNPMSGVTTDVEYDVVNVVIGIFSGETLEDLDEVGLGSSGSPASFTAAVGETYYIAVAGQGGAEGLVALEVLGAPANSTLELAQPLVVGRNFSGSNINSGSEAGEPDHAGNTASASVWYKWTAPFSGRVAFSTRHSNFDTVAAVYSGPATDPTMAALVPVAANADAIGMSANFSRVEFQAISGTTYYIAVDGKNGARGRINATFGIPPANDHLDDATVIQGTDITRSFTTAFASREENEPQHWPNAGLGETVWFTWTAPENGRASLDLSGSFFRGIIAVYTGNTLENLDLVARDGAAGRYAQVGFDAMQGTTYRIAVDAWDMSLHNVPLRLVMVPIPPNELFANAIELQGKRATQTGSNVGAGRENGDDEPRSNYNSGPSVWYRWTAPVSGKFGLYGERLDKVENPLWSIVLNIFTGTDVENFDFDKHIRLNDYTHAMERYAEWGNGIGRDAFARFEAVAGTTYHIQVTGLDGTVSRATGGTGSFRLDLRPLEEHTPPNHRFENAIELDGSPIFNYRTQNYAASGEDGEGGHGHESRTSGYRSLWWKFEVPPGGAGTYAVANSRSEGRIWTAIYRAETPVPPSIDALNLVTNNWDVSSNMFPDLTFEAEENQVYYIVLDNHNQGTDSDGRVIFQFQKVPENIVFAGAADIPSEIPSEGIQKVAYNWGAKHEAGEPGAIDGVDVGRRSLWWKWTPAVTGLYQIDTIGSRTALREDDVAMVRLGNPPGIGLVSGITGLNTALGIYTGNGIGSLSTVVTNGRISEYGTLWSFHRNSRVIFNANAGTTYHIMVNGQSYQNPPEQNTAQGEILLNIAPFTPAENSVFANAKEIIGTEYHTIISNLGATKESGEPNHGGITGGRSLWWKWTAPESGPFIVSTAGNIYDDYHAHRTGLGVYTGSAVNNLITIASDQNGAGPHSGDHTWSALSFEATAGTTYYFGADSVHAGNLSFILTRPAPNDDFADATVMQGSRWVSTGHNLMTTKETGEVRLHRPTGASPDPTDENTRSVWWRWTAPVSGTITLETLGSQVWLAMDVYTGDAIGSLSAPMIDSASAGDVGNGEGPGRARSGTKRHTFTAVAGTTYNISIQGIQFPMASSGPIRLELTGPPDVPWAPENVVAERVGESQIDLTWDDVAVDEEAYEIERSTDDGETWTLIRVTNPNVNQYTDFDTAEGHEYFYRIRAVNIVGESEWVYADIPRPPTAPGSFNAEAISHTAIALTWTPPVAANTLRLERSLTGENGPWGIVAAQLPGSMSQFTDRGLTPETTVHYRLRAYNDIGYSEPAFADAETLATPSVNITFDDEVVVESNRTVQATISRTDTNAPLTLLLRANDARMQPPYSVTLPEGVSELTFAVDLKDDSIENVSEWATLTAFAPYAVVGESFEGPHESLLGGQTTGWGWGGAWIVPSDRNSHELDEPNLSYSQNGTIGTPGTRFARVAGGSTYTYRSFSDISSDSVWVSCLLHRGNNSSGNTQVIARGSGKIGRVRYDHSGERWVLESATSGATVTLLDSNPRETTFFVVMEFDFANGKIRAWMDPDVLGGAPTNALASAEVHMQEDMAVISRVDIIGHHDTDGFDEIRVATSFADLYSGDEYTADLRIIDNDALTPLQLWRQTYYDTPLNEGDAANEHAPEEDNWPNLLRYATGLAPSDSVRTEDLFRPVLLNGGTEIGVRFPRSTVATDIIWEVEQATDLTAADWSIIWSSMAGTGQELLHGVEADGGREVITIQTPEPDLLPHRFLRLRVMEQ